MGFKPLLDHCRSFTNALPFAPAPFPRILPIRADMKVPD